MIQVPFANVLEGLGMLGDKYRISLNMMPSRTCVLLETCLYCFRINYERSWSEWSQWAWFPRWTHPLLSTLVWWWCRRYLVTYNKLCTFKYLERSASVGETLCKLTGTTIFSKLETLQQFHWDLLIPLLCWCLINLALNLLTSYLESILLQFAWERQLLVLHCAVTATTPSSSLLIVCYWNSSGALDMGSFHFSSTTFCKWPLQNFSKLDVYIL